MSELLQFLLSMEIKEANGENGDTVESKINGASYVIGDKAKYKFRVIGEAKIIAIFEVNDDSVVNTVTSDIMRRGPYAVTCTPLTNFESWENLLGRSGFQNMFNLAVPRILSGKHVVWFEVAYDHGISHDEFDKLWSMRAKTMIGQWRQGLMEIEIFKVLGERRIYAFSCKTDFENWEAHLWKFNMEDKIYKNAKLVTQL
ncbi:uncharacterized protein LOC127723549 isoform X3 [Mytilus californianus]|uniref:uncharacterized protein LOC127723549 isoform X3 n=1 Tax=Mytilus californianus TaxID=6549 RepID=UPI0022483C4A|nr:uncharacterized protein LOC127723549 isoform X3 [Mytilus californianus]XP_052086171.1 uncharacterized protein LOC127723549 isoform X3 [Mytilus californianus]XP_052086172.1 uncharacterized protein LOC127723549 isoform X3 [Mytilus californianus]